MLIQEIETLNQSFFLKMNATPNMPEWLFYIARVVAHDLIFCLPVLLAIMWLCGSHRVRSTALEAFFAVAIALSLNKLIGYFWTTPRPFVIGLGHQYLEHAATSSFPSNHMTIFACIAITLLWQRFFMFGFFLLVIGLVVGHARVFLGVHFPFDLMGGIVVAVLVCSILDFFWRRIGDAITYFWDSFFYRKKLEQFIHHLLAIIGTHRKS